MSDSQPGETDWRAQVIAAAQKDLETRSRLARSGALFEGYHPEMEAVHDENAALLDRVLAAVGWPGRERFGEDGAGAAFLILQHAIGHPDLQRKGLTLILEAIPRGDASALDAAYLSDRIAVFEGKPQIFGTQFDWLDGELAPSPLADPERVDEYRQSVGLPPLSEAVAEMRRRAAAEGQRPPADLASRKAKFEAWAQKVGWRAASPA